MNAFQIREWLTADEISGLMGISARAVRKMAQRQRWKARERDSGKGFEYHISALHQVDRETWVRQACEAFLAEMGVHGTPVRAILAPPAIGDLMKAISCQLANA